MDCVQPLPDCNDPQVIQNDFTPFNRTIYDCWNDRERYLISRIYLAVAIFNGVCIILTTGLFIYFAYGSSTVKPPSRLSSRGLQQLWKKHSIQQRSVMGTTLGAVGHLVFSSCILLSQAVHGSVGCELLIWGICIGFYTWMIAFYIRAHRLKFMFRLNRLKVKYLRMPTSDRLLCIDDKDYQWYISHKNSIRKSLMKPYIYYIISIALITVIAVPIEVTTVRQQGYCPQQRSIGLFIGLFAVFILFMVPFILWYLKDNGDAHGIRQELWIDAIIGIPMFIVYMVLFFTLQPEAFTRPILFYIKFRPGNIPVIFTACAHIMSVVIPVIAFLPIRNKHWVKFKNHVYKRFTFRRRPISSSTTNMSKIDSVEENNDPSTSNSITDIELMPDLSVESLERSMSDPVMMRQLQDLAIRDFSSENVLFYESYLDLENKFKCFYARPDSDGNNISRNWIQSYIIKKPSTNTSSTNIQEEPKCTEIEQQQKLQKYLSTPIPYKLYPAFIRFYETFIAENTSSQVNISYRARHNIDIVFKNLYEKFPDLNPRIESSSSNRSIINTLTSRISSDEPFDKYTKENEQEEESLSLTLGVFETARIEVCWNIFNSVYPKFVEMYNCDSST